MRVSSPVRYFLALGLACLTMVVLCPAAAQEATTSSAPVVLDRVVAVVNRQVVLSSDLDLEMRLATLDPVPGTRGAVTRRRALQLLISRSLIQQQIRQEEMQALRPTQEEVDARLTEMRKDLPACAGQNCLSDTGWKAFLAARDLTPQEVVIYLRNRLEILGFIEQRFRQGIDITPKQIESYYTDTFLAQYPAGQTPPPLSKVSARIQEILLQQQVNVLFSNWLQNLRKQGDIEVLDPSLELPASGNGQGGGAQ